MPSIKYKDSTTGQMKPLGVKVEDTLPVGTEVDYDGQDIPEGWVEIDDVLWENPNPSATSEFPAQSIALSESWDRLLIVCRKSYNDGQEIVIPIMKGSTNGFTLSFSEFAYDSTKGSGIKVVTRYNNFNASDDKILNIGVCYGQEIYGSGTNALQNLQGNLVPMKIYKF